MQIKLFFLSLLISSMVCFPALEDDSEYLSYTPLSPKDFYKGLIEGIGGSSNQGKAFINCGKYKDEINTYEEECKTLVQLLKANNYNPSTDPGGFKQTLSLIYENMAVFYDACISFDDTPLNEFFNNIENIPEFWEDRFTTVKDDHESLKTNVDDYFKAVKDGDKEEMGEYLSGTFYFFAEVSSLKLNLFPVITLLLLSLLF
jgi:hypothetical protein